MKVICRYSASSALSCLSWQRNHLKEPNEPANENRVRAIPEHTCRILDFSPVDQIHFASLRRYAAPHFCVLPHSKRWTQNSILKFWQNVPRLISRSVIERRFYRYHDLQAGQVVEVRIKNHLLFNCSVLYPSYRFKNPLKQHMAASHFKSPEGLHLNFHRVDTQTYISSPSISVQTVQRRFSTENILYIRNNFG